MNNLKHKNSNNQPTDSLKMGSTALFDVLVNQNENGIFYLENDSLIYANDAFSKLLNIPNPLSHSKSILHFFKGSNKPLMKKGIDVLIEGKKEEFKHDLSFENENGNLAYFSIQLKIQSRVGEKITIAGSSRDITARVLKNKKAQESKVMFDALYNNIVDGILIYDYNEEKILDSNKVACEIFAYETKKEFQTYNRFQFVPEYSHLFPGEDLHKHVKEHETRVRNGEAFKAFGIFVKANGEHIIVRVTFVPTFRAEGEAFIIFQDNTKRFMTKRAHRKSEKRYREVFNNSHEGIIYMDAKTFFPIMCNEQSLKFFGVNTFEEFSKLDYQEFFVDKLIEGLRPIDFYASKMREALKRGRSESMYRIKNQTDEITTVSVVMICDHRDKKDPKVIAFVRDVTSLHKARVVLNEKNEELEKYITANLQLENFAYFASHDLQTPLRSIISFTQLLKRSLKGETTESQQEYMDFIIDSTKNMRNLVNDLLSYSRVNAAGINLEEVSVEKLLKQLCIELTTIIEEKNAKIETKNLPNKIMADATKLRQVFQNLITNGVKFSDADKSPKIKISCQEEENHWLFSVTDNGIGIHPDYKERIFLLFKRLHNNDEYEGTGIGLAMVKKIVEQHEGKIWLESTVGEGSTFYFTIRKSN